MELSNKMLALLLVAAIVVSLGGTIISLNKLNKFASTTGAATGSDSGLTNFSLTSDVSIAFTQAVVDFGAGSINATGAGIQYCMLTSADSSQSNVSPFDYCIGNFNLASLNFTVENQGNVNVSLEIASNATAATFVGGTVPYFNWSVSENEAGACPMINATLLNFVNVTTTNQTVCPASGFAYGDADSVNIAIKIVIPEDAPQTEHTATIYAYGTA